ncbi:Lrp/AsnC family transcriptional regulator [Hydrogenophilus thiooxidans]|uniref:Lrp/AsnC family transcriptional regulator n=1 Tax=Hydrogenophilus thiooxidans TaxID=2820326 RepID=UPI001C2200AD|nr:Lrp/AsnC family transcriptional regulator [Hydrogenophilus thiooxidans]
MNAKELLDPVDWEILRLLQRDATHALAAIGEAVGLSPSQVARRKQQLERRGFIKATPAILDGARLGFGVVAFASLWLERHSATRPEAFERAVALLPPIVECHAITGSADYWLKIVAPDLETLGRFVRESVLRLPGVARIETHIRLQGVKETTELPLALVHR